MHTFNESSLTVDLIRNLLYRYWLPVYDTVQPGDYIHCGMYYIYRDDLIKCTTSGYIFGKQREQIDQTTGNKYYITINRAHFRVIQPYMLGGKYRKFTSNFVSNNNLYTTALHEYLGKFVRTYSDVTGINLMPYYNCNSNKLVEIAYMAMDENSDVSLYYDSAYSRYKIYSIPIRFNHTYTIAMDSPTTVYAYPVFSSHNNLIKLINDNGESVNISEEFLDQTKQYYKFNSLSFTQPKHISINCTYDIADSYLKYQKNLRLLIQVDKDNDSSLVVLEGDYTGNYSQVTITSSSYIPDTNTTVWTNEKVVPQHYINYEHINLLDNYKLNKSFNPNPSLLQYNIKQQIPFADRLIEYLFDNVIDYTWKLDSNIKQLQPLLSDRIEGSDIEGVWDLRLRAKLYQQGWSDSSNSRHLDISGNVDRETEKLLLNSPFNFERTF